jgi:hypothetical protein
VQSPFYYVGEHCKVGHHGHWGSNQNLQSLLSGSDLTHICKLEYLPSLITACKIIIAAKIRKLPNSCCAPVSSERLRLHIGYTTHRYMSRCSSNYSLFIYSLFMYEFPVPTFTTKEPRYYYLVEAEIRKVSLVQVTTI